MDIAGLIASFATGTYTVTRTATSSYASRGRAAPGAVTTFSISAAVCPITGNDLKRLPEGFRASEAVTIFTSTQLTVGGQVEDFEADVVTIDGSPWQVNHVETWRDPLGPVLGYKCIATSMVG